MFSSQNVLFVVVLTCLFTFTLAQEPIQKRISLLPDGMTVSWTTVGPLSTTPAVMYGTAPDRLSDRADGFSRHYDAATTWWHHVEIHGLRPNTTYYWNVITPQNQTSKVLQFTTAPPVGTESGFRVAIYGDLGIDNSVNTLILLNNITRNTELYWHVGDLAYADDHRDTTFTYEQIYEGWMNNMTTIWDEKPYMVLPGNHEYSCGGGNCPSQTNFSAYNARFHMPHRYSGSETNMVYSFDYANTHFVQISTETDYPDAYEGEGGNFIKNQYDWLETDLQKATANRHHVPWILVGGHRPFYHSEGIDARLVDYFEPLFLKYKVDAVFVGHIHYYERMYSIKNGTACSESYYNAPCPIYIITGAAGNIEGISKKPAKLAPYSAVEISEFGIGTLHVHNNTHMTWRFIQSDNDQSLDTIVISKDAANARMIKSME